MKNTTNITNTLKKTCLKKALLVAAVGASVALSGAVSAGQYNNHKGYNNDDYNNIDYARVIKVKPITKSIEVVNPVRTCWDEQVRRKHQPRRSHHNVKGEIFGALIGAAVGNRVGKSSRGRNGRDIATAAGAVIGGVIGHDATNRRDTYVTYDTVQRCEVEQQVTYEEQVVAYKVRYKYRGKVYETRMNNHPGDRIKVRVSVTPVEYS